MNQTHLRIAFYLFTWIAMALPAIAQTPYPTVSLSRLPDALQQQYKKIQPDFTDKSHCAAAWDSPSDGEKMAFRCSIFIKMSAEGERRAMRYCDEKREEHKIKSPCRLIVEP
jgi:hypothetical protein